MTRENIVKWIAVVICIGGALATSFRFDPINIYLLNISAFLFLIWAVMIRDKGMITVNFGLLVCYVIGLFVK
jgi:hypothetical protein